MQNVVTCLLCEVSHQEHITPVKPGKWPLPLPCCAIEISRGSQAEAPSVQTGANCQKDVLSGPSCWSWFYLQLVQGNPNVFTVRACCKASMYSLVIGQGAGWRKLLTRSPVMVYCLFCWMQMRWEATQGGTAVEVNYGRVPRAWHGHLFICCKSK